MDAESTLITDTSDMPASPSRPSFQALVSQLHDCVVKSLTPWEQYQEVVVVELASLREHAGTTISSTATALQVSSPVRVVVALK